MSVVLSSVKAGKCGILGLDDDTLHLTAGNFCSRKVQKALLTSTNYEYMDTSVASLTSVTYFGASRCGDSLHSVVIYGYYQLHVPTYRC